MIEVQYYDGTNWRTVERGVPYLVPYWIRAMESAARTHPGRRVRAVDADGRVIDILQ